MLSSRASLRLSSIDLSAAGKSPVMEKAVAQARSLDDKWLLGNTLAILATAFSITGDFSAAEESIEESLKLAHELNMKEYLAFPLGVRGQIRGLQYHDYAGARSDMEAAMRMAGETGNRAGMGMTLVSLALIDILEERYPDAAARLQQAIAVLHQARDWAFENVAHSALADVRRLTGEYAEAAQLYRQTIRNHQLSGNQGGIARCIECLAFMQVEQAQTGTAEGQTDHLRWAAMLFGAAESIRTTSGARMTVREPEEYAQYVDRLGALMDDRAREAAWAEGRRMTVEQVLTESGGQNEL